MTAAIAALLRLRKFFTSDIGKYVAIGLAGIVVVLYFQHKISSHTKEQIKIQTKIFELEDTIERQKAAIQIIRTFQELEKRALEERIVKGVELQNQLNTDLIELGQFTESRSKESSQVLKEAVRRLK